MGYTVFHETFNAKSAEHVFSMGHSNLYIVAINLGFNVVKFLGKHRFHGFDGNMFKGYGLKLGCWWARWGFKQPSIYIYMGLPVGYNIDVVGYIYIYIYNQHTWYIYIYIWVCMKIGELPWRYSHQRTVKILIHQWMGSGFGNDCSYMCF